MIGWVFGVPLFLTVLLIALERLEASVVRPIDHAERVQRLLVSDAPSDDVERQVATLYASVLPPSRRAP